MGKKDKKRDAPEDYVVDIKFKPVPEVLEHFSPGIYQESDFAFFSNSDLISEIVGVESEFLVEDPSSKVFFSSKNFRFYLLVEGLVPNSKVEVVSVIAKVKEEVYRVVPVNSNISMQQIIGKKEPSSHFTPILFQVQDLPDIRGELKIETRLTFQYKNIHKVFEGEGTFFFDYPLKVITKPKRFFQKRESDGSLISKYFLQITVGNKSKYPILFSKHNLAVHSVYTNEGKTQKVLPEEDGAPSRFQIKEYEIYRKKYLGSKDTICFSYSVDLPVEDSVIDISEFQFSFQWNSVQNQVGSTYMQTFQNSEFSVLLSEGVSCAYIRDFSLDPKLLSPMKVSVIIVNYSPLKKDLLATVLPSKEFGVVSQSKNIKVETIKKHSTGILEFQVIPLVKGYCKLPDIQLEDTNSKSTWKLSSEYIVNVT